MEGNKMSKEMTEQWRNEEIFGITKGHCLDLCLNTPFPGTENGQQIIQFGTVM